MIQTKNEEKLITTPDCPKCLSTDVLFNQFRGAWIIQDETQPAQGMVLLAEQFTCQSCKNEFEKTDGPWIGLELAAWAEAMKHELEFDKVVDYTNWIRETRRE